MSNGTTSAGTILNGNMSNGNMSNGNDTNGHMPKGNMSNGTNSNRDRYTETNANKEAPQSIPMIHASQLKAKANPRWTLSEGRPVSDNSTSQQIRRTGGGLLVLQDTQLIEELAHFARERIPERVVHAKAAGARGTFTVTHDISDITDAAFMTGIGKETPVLFRAGTVGPEKGSADTLRDPRGFAVKFFTDEGINDWVFNNMPMFFVRDPIKFPSVNRAHKRNPQTNLLHVHDSTQYWDFHNNNQEGMHMLMNLFSDRGIPATLRHMHGFSGHTYKFTKEDGSYKYVKIHFKTDQGIKTLTQAEGEELAGEAPDNHLKDFFEAIERGDYPSWTGYLQVMDPKDAENYRWNIFDMTKVWPHKDYPLRPFGKLVLNENPQNYFADVENAAFSPSNMVPGIESSADPMLQARMFSYPDAQRYRLGVNFAQLPTNAPRQQIYSPLQRDGAANFRGNYGPDPNYIRSSLRPVNFKPKSSDRAHDEWIGKLTDFTTEVTDEDFVQAKMLWDVIGRAEGGQDRFVANVSGHLSTALPYVQKGAIESFARVDQDLATRIEKGLKGE